MTSFLLFRIAAGSALAIFLRYGMDLRRRPGARYLTHPASQAGLKLAALLLLAGHGWVLASLGRVAPLDWLALLPLLAGAGLVWAGKRRLGRWHSFSGQFREDGELVTDGIYAATRNPLYLGVFLFELGATGLALHQLPLLRPMDWPWWLALAGAALAYAVWFNLTMAVAEARQLERRFGAAYRAYRDRVPFLLPRLRRAAAVPPAAGATMPTRRSFRLAADADLAPRGSWVPGRPLLSQLLLAYALIVPEGESYILRSCRPFLGAAGPELRARLQALFFQESSHAREHRRLLAAMQAEGLALDRLRAAIEGFLYRVLEPMSPALLRLATAAAIEQHNGALARWVLGRGLLDAAAPTELRRLFLWHLVEELEHEAVVPELLRAVSASGLLRFLGLVGSAGTFLAYLWIGTLACVLQARREGTRGFARELAEHCRGRDGLPAILVRRSLCFLRGRAVADAASLHDAALAALDLPAAACGSLAR
jgi:predicted metal-dependent hydrolase/protein-S-isoprenylcysteine O-methyltransferase Ste14